MAIIKNVALIGASGSLGSVILEKLLASGSFNIRVLRRPSSPATFPSNIEVVDVALESVEAVTAALAGQDALISALGTSQVSQQAYLIDACIAAGVYRFIPAEFGADVERPKVQGLPAYAHHVKLRNELIKKSNASDLTYTFVHNGGFLDWGLQHDFLLKISDYEPLIIDNGEHVFSATTVPSIANAVVGILQNPGETENRPVYIEDVKINQATLFRLATEVAPEKPWAPKHVRLEDMIAEADAKVAQGFVDDETLIPYLYFALMDAECGGSFHKTDNELFGLKGINEDDVKTILRQYIK